MERDDIYEYSLDTHHNEEQGKKIRKKIWFVTFVLSAITALEVILGIFVKHTSGLWPVVKWSFIVMTIVKAAYIVLVFMHLGDEKKSFKYIVLVPYLIFIVYITFILLTEGSAVGHTLNMHAV